RVCPKEEAVAARAVLRPELARRNKAALLTVWAVGHAHMDLAWLWPIRETIRKCGRTFATALAMLERYPDYIFGASQPQQYAWVKEHYPSLYEGVKKRVAEGRWEVQGAMWVESDINVPSGESLIRQILYGKRFFREEFGKKPVSLWQPDVFGYSGSLPQLLVKSGVRHFMTQKLSWNWVTRHPHHTFWWQGIDGSAVLAHMPPEDTYNSSAAAMAAEFAGAWYPHAELERIWKEVLLYQFHDILPGSSITRVYDESLARYAVLTREVEELTAAADAGLSRQIARSDSARPLVVINSLCWDRAEWLK